MKAQYLLTLHDNQKHSVSIQPIVVEGTFPNPPSPEDSCKLLEELGNIIRKWAGV